MATELAAILHRLDLLEREVARLGDENTVLKKCLQKLNPRWAEVEAAEWHRLKFERMCEQSGGPIVGPTALADDDGQHVD